MPVVWRGWGPFHCRCGWHGTLFLGCGMPFFLKRNLSLPLPQFQPIILSAVVVGGRRVGCFGLRRSIDECIGTATPPLPQTGIAVIPPVVSSFAVVLVAFFFLVQSMGIVLVALELRRSVAVLPSTSRTIVSEIARIQGMAIAVIALPRRRRSVPLAAGMVALLSLGTVILTSMRLPSMMERMVSSVVIFIISLVSLIIVAVPTTISIVVFGTIAIIPVLLPTTTTTSVITFLIPSTSTSTSTSTSKCTSTTSIISIKLPFQLSRLQRTPTSSLLAVAILLIPIPHPLLFGMERPYPRRRAKFASQEFFHPVGLVSSHPSSSCRRGCTRRGR
mmetsp:Transcript_6147/g.13483  ORF Transcript_6147/g.13483 Transcript_6147/m.13483 type:complete len:332 (-) Transcript_6147:3-998(-)